MCGHGSLLRRMSNRTRYTPSMRTAPVNRSPFVILAGERHTIKNDFHHNFMVHLLSIDRGPGSHRLSDYQDDALGLCAPTGLATFVCFRFPFAATYPRLRAGCYSTSTKPKSTLS